MRLSGLKQLDPSQPLPFRKRADVIVVPRPESGTWVVKDPLLDAYYLLGAAEQFLWERLNGQHTLVQLQTEYTRRFAPQQLSIDDLWRYLSQMAAQGLLLGLGTAESTASPPASIWSQLRSNPLAIRLRGIDPDQYLNVITPWLSWCFTQPIVLLWGAFMLLTTGLLWSESEQLVREIRLWPAQPTQALLGLMVGIAIMKVLHELGHALVCKRFGGDCHELGVMFLLGTPCLYCNVSDAWLFPSRWQRAAVCAAGIYVELIVATLAAWVWWLSVPGVVHQLALQLVLIGSVNTLLINGNPLLRYDGYYVLSDLCDIPNLRSRASAIWQLWWTRGVFGRCVGVMPRVPVVTQLGLGLYGLASSIYVWMLLIGILLAFHAWLRPWGIEGVVTAGGTLLVGARLASTGWHVGRLFQHAISLNSVSTSGRWRTGVGAVLVVLAPLLIACLPWSPAVHVPAVVLPTDSETCYVLTAGTSSDVPPVLSYARPVEADETILKLHNLDLARNLTALEGDLAQLTRRVHTLEQRLAREPHLAAVLSANSVAVSALQEQIDSERRRQQQLAVRTHRRGILIPPQQAKGFQPSAPAGVLPSTATSPPQGRTVRTWIVGEPAGRVIGHERSALLYVPQHQLTSLALGQSLVLQFPQQPGVNVFGTVVDLGSRPLVEPPPELLTDGRLATVTDFGGIRFLQPVYAVKVALPESQRLLLNQMGTARWHSPALPIWKHVVQAVQEVLY